MSRLLTVNEVAERLRIHPITVRRHIKSGRLRATRVGRSVRVPEEAIQAMSDVSSRATDARRELTKEELLAWISRTPTHAELEQRKRVGEEMRRLQVSVDIPTGVLKRVARREDEYVYGDKSFDEVVAEEMEYEKD
jgi:excisionase family DNA binding protein